MFFACLKLRKSQQKIDTPQRKKSDSNPFRNGLVASIKKSDSKYKENDVIYDEMKMTGFNTVGARQNIRKRIMRIKALQIQQEMERSKVMTVKQPNISDTRGLLPIPSRPRHRFPPPIPPRTMREIKYSHAQLWAILQSKTFQSPSLPDIQSINEIKGSFYKVTEKINYSRIPESKFVISDDMFRIRIVAYLLPDYFTFQFELDEIIKLQRSLKKFYLEYPDKRGMRAKKLFSGQVVVVKYQGEWYRAEVKNFGQYSARVQFIDHMRFLLLEIDLKNISYLHRQFEKIPRKSAIGGIDGITSVEKRWTHSERNKVRHILPHEVMARVEGYCCSVWKLSLFDVNRKPLKDIILKQCAAKDVVAQNE